MGGRIDSCIYWPGHHGGAGVQPASSKLGSGNASRAVGAEATPVLMELCFRASEGLFVRPGGGLPADCRQAVAARVRHQHRLGRRGRDGQLRGA